MQSAEGEGKMKPCHSSLFTQHKAAAFQMEERRLRWFIPHVPATLKPITFISLRHQYNITCLVLLHPRESEEVDTSEKKPGDTHEFLTFIYSSHFFLYLKYSVLFCLSEVNLPLPSRPVPFILFFGTFSCKGSRPTAESTHACVH